MRYAEHGESGPGKVPAQPTTVSRMSAAPRRCQSEWCHADRSDLRAQEASSERLERRRVTRGEEPMHWRGAGRGRSGKGRVGEEGRSRWAADHLKKKKK